MVEDGCLVVGTALACCISEIWLWMTVDHNDFRKEKKRKTRLKKLWNWCSVVSHLTILYEMSCHNEKQILFYFSFPFCFVLFLSLDTSCSIQWLLPSLLRGNSMQLCNAKSVHPCLLNYSLPSSRKHLAVIHIERGSSRPLCFWSKHFLLNLHNKTKSKFKEGLLFSMK